VSVDRRTFLKGAAVAAGVAVTGSTGILLSRSADARRGRRWVPPDWTARNRLFIPPVVDLADLTEPYQLEAAAATLNFGPSSGLAWVYNGVFPGPTLLARKGDSAQLKLLNKLAEDTIIHWHGMVVDHPNDGHPKQIVGTGGVYDYSFPIVQRAALNWYHPHPDMLTGEQAAMGLAGGFILRDDEEDALGLPASRPPATGFPAPASGYEVPLVIRDSDFDNAGNLKHSESGAISMVNGTIDPYLPVDRALYRFRILGGFHTARVARIALSHGLTFTLIGNDGGLLPEPVDVSEILVSSGERVDVLVDFRRVERGTEVLLRDVDAGRDVLGFQVLWSFGDDSQPPEVLPSITPLSSPVRTRTFTFDGMSRINGLVYDISRIDFQVPFGDTELWSFTTGGTGPHPVHVHGASFQVVSRTGGRGQVYPWERGWKDTVLLLDNETVDVLIRFDAYRGEYLIHCHRMQHEDRGMMSNFEVV